MNQDENITPFVPRDVAKGQMGIDTPSAQEELPAADWQKISDFLNVPLDPNAGQMATQIGEFFRENIVATGQETLRTNGQEFTLPTASLKVPRPEFMGVPTAGWYLFQVAQEDGATRIEVIAEKQDFPSQGETPAQRSGSEVAFIKPAGS